MRYTLKQYATAFAGLARDARSPQEKRALVKNFIALLERNGDITRREHIVRAAERAVRKQLGRRTVLIETARAVEGARKHLSRVLKPTDSIEEKISPELIAGVRVTVDDEYQFDGSLTRKLDALFNN